MPIRDPFTNKFIGNEEAKRRGWLQPDGTVRIPTEQVLTAAISGQIRGGGGGLPSPGMEHAGAATSSLQTSSFSVNGKTIDSSGPSPEEIDEKQRAEDMQLRRVPRFVHDGHRPGITRVDFREHMEKIGNMGADAQFGLTATELEEISKMQQMAAQGVVGSQWAELPSRMEPCLPSPSLGTVKLTVSRVRREIYIWLCLLFAVTVWTSAGAILQYSHPTFVSSVIGWCDHAVSKARRVVYVILED